MAIKILHILDSLKIGGLENGVVNLLNNLNHSKFSHSICCLREVGPMADRLIRPDVRITCMNNTGRDYSMPVKLTSLIGRLQPDIVHTRNWGTIDGIVAAKLARVRHIVHGEHGREYNDINGINFRRNLVRRVLLTAVDKIVVVSADLKTWLVKRVGICPKKISTIINGVNTTEFCQAADKAIAKRSIGIDPDAFVIGTVGRLDKVKNYQMIVRSVSQIREYNYPLVVLFVGDGPERPHLEEFVRINKLTSVKFLGEKANVSNYLKAFDLFVLTSLAEGISNTILEAMASGLPVIATQVGGNPELVEDNVTG